MNNNNNLLIEIGTEEIPSKMVIKIAENFHKNFKNELQKYKIEYKKINLFHSPKRIAIKISKFNTCIIMEKKKYRGPSIKNSFNSEGLLTLSAIKWLKKINISIKKVKKMKNIKGEWLFYEKIKKNSIIKILPKIIQSSIKNIKKYNIMIWNETEIKFCRPIRNIVIMINERVIKINIFGIQSNKYTYGNICTIPKKIEINQAVKYEEILYSKGKVIVDFELRKKKIFDESHQIVNKKIGKLKIKKKFLDEITCLVEWPTALCGNFKKKFLILPDVVLIYIMEKIQKYIPIYNQKNKLTSNFIIISNNPFKNYNNIIKGNERVLNARLTDATFFLKNDKKKKLKNHFYSLKEIIFHEKLGSMYKKSKRLITIIQYIIQYTNANLKDSLYSAYLSKCDLKTKMVYEFPELQGKIGMHYAINNREKKKIALSLKEQYEPKFSKDNIPSNKIGYSLSLADKIDTIVGLFLIKKHPKNDKDPFGLRRITLGIIKIIIKNKININLNLLIKNSINTYNIIDKKKKIKTKIINFIKNRLFAWFKEKYDTEIIKSVFSYSIKNFIDVKKRIEIIYKFKNNLLFKNLLITHKRIKNLIKNINFKINKKYNISYTLIQNKEEKKLFQIINITEKKINSLINEKKYEELIKKLFKINDLTNKFLNSTSIKNDSKEIKINRIAILNKIKKKILKISLF